MTAYEGKYAFLLVRWWADLQKADDLAKAFHTSMHNLDAFIGYFRSNAALMFEADDSGIWFAASSTPFFDGALWDIWIRPNKRHLPSAWKATQLAYSLALDQYPSLIGLTKQPELHAVHLKLGYEYAGRLKNLMDGSTIYSYQLTREGWANRRASAAGVRSEKRERRQQAEYTNGAVQQ